jgi:PAS domain S-box-containing protein
MVESTSDWIWEVDQEGRYTFSNRKVADILGYSIKEVMGRTPFDFMPPDEALRIRKAFGAIAAARKPFSGLENINLHKSGRQLVLETSGVPIFGEQGEFCGFRGIDRDITARKHTEQELHKSCGRLEKRVKQTCCEIGEKQAALEHEVAIRRQIETELANRERQFQSLVEALNEGFGIVDAETRLTYVNAKFLEILGYSYNEVLGKKISDFMDARNRRLFTKQIGIRQQGIDTPYEIRFKSKEGRIIPTIVSPRGRFGGDGSFQGSYAVITDISAVKGAEKALRRRERQLREKTRRLQEMNTALEVLLRKREQDKTIIQKRIFINLKRLVAPYLEALGETRMSERQRYLVEVLRSNLVEVMSPFSDRPLWDKADLTRTELEVADLVRLGKSTTQIADALGVSYKTAETHRWHIRKKLGLNRRRVSLMSYLSRAHDPV